VTLLFSLSLKCDLIIDNSTVDECYSSGRVIDFSVTKLFRYKKYHCYFVNIYHRFIYHTVKITKLICFISQALEVQSQNCFPVTLVGPQHECPHEALQGYLVTLAITFTSDFEWL